MEVHRPRGDAEPEHGLDREVVLRVGARGDAGVPDGQVVEGEVVATKDGAEAAEGVEETGGPREENVDRVGLQRRACRPCKP